MRNQTPQPAEQMRRTSPPDEDPDEMNALEDKLATEEKLNETPTSIGAQKMATDDMAS